MKLARWSALLVIAAAASGCVDTGQARVAIPLRVAGSVSDAPIAAAGGFSVELERAELAFGPLYLCAGVLAGDNCETARLEWLDSVVVDARSPELRDAGVLDGVSGPMRSGMYDLGISSLLTLPEPLVLPAAASLDGNSVWLAGVAARADERVSFELALPLAQGAAAEIGVSIVRVSDAAGLEHDVTGDEGALVVRFDARPWLADVDFSTALDQSPRAADAIVRFDAESQPARALRAALLSGPRPTFEWQGAR
jgi:hypothetical protein